MGMPAAIWMSRTLSTSFSLPYADEATLRSFCVTFRPHDKILLFPPSLQTAKLLRTVVEQHWGLDSHETDPDCYTLNLTGSPFLKHARRDNALTVKFLCGAILDKFKSYGWELIVCSDLSVKTDLTAWYFARAPLHASGAHPSGLECADEMVRPRAHRLANMQVQAQMERRGSTSSVDMSPPTLVCLSMSKKRKLQLINAPPALHQVLKTAVEESYRFGVDAEGVRGNDSRHYELKLRGTPWDTTNRDQLTSACRMLGNVFTEFNARGYRFYGLVNFKETSDSMFFEYDQAVERYARTDRHMVVTMDGSSVLRLVGVSRSTAEVVEKMLETHWEAGLQAKMTLVDESVEDTLNGERPFRALYSDHRTYECVMKGTPWLSKLTRISKTRQIVARLLDALLTEGWTVVTGLDISRGLNSKSALVFETCAAANLRHACVSPLGRQSLQLVNGPASLRRLIQHEFQKIISAEKAVNEGRTEDGFLDAVFEAKINGFHWDPHPEKDAVEYVYTRRQMGLLLQRLMDAGWRVVVSADVGHHQEDTDVGEGIHSWFLIHAGDADSVVRESTPVDQPEAVRTMMNVSSRMGRRASAFAYTALSDAQRRNTIAPTSGSPLHRKRLA